MKKYCASARDLAACGFPPRPCSRRGPADREARIEEPAAEQRGGALTGCLTFQMSAGPAVVFQHPCDIRPGERRAAEHFVAVAELGRFGAQELPARRGIEVQVFDRNGRARRARGGLYLPDPGTFGAQRVAMRRTRTAGRDRQARHRSDRGERLAAKPHRRHLLEVFERADLARRVARKRERQVVARDPFAIVLDLHAPDAAFIERDGNRLRARVDAVFEQFLQDRGGTLDHFARCDLADEQLGQDADRVHRAGL